MSQTEPENWNTGSKSGLISICSHKLYLHVTGPDRVNGEPVIIVMTGVTNTIAAWIAVQRMTSPFARVVAYDRSGLGQSEQSPNPPTSTTIAKELDALLKASNIAPPYITLGHSWGGILTQEFFALRPHDIVGMIFVDATQARYLDLIPFTDPAIAAINTGLDWFNVIQLKQGSALTADEYAAFLAAEQNPSTQQQIGREFMALFESNSVSGKHEFFGRQPPLLGRRPVCVVKGHNHRDIERAYAAGVEAGNGTAAERARHREILETWDEKELELQREYLSLSERNKFIVAEKGGHNVHMTDPEVVVEGIKWTLANIERQAS